MDQVVHFSLQSGLCTSWPGQIRNHLLRIKYLLLCPGSDFFKFKDEEF